MHVSSIPDLVAPMRGAFERTLLAAAREGATPLSYAFWPAQYRFLTAGAAKFIDPGDLTSFMTRIGGWARQHVGAASISTPQLRVYTGGCRRSLARDETAGEWRYCYSLTLRPRTGRMDVLDGLTDSRRSRVIRTARFNFEPGALFVHNARCSYRVQVRGDAEPLDGLVFLDGYLW